MARLAASFLCSQVSSSVRLPPLSISLALPGWSQHAQAFQTLVCGAPATCGLTCLCMLQNRAHCGCMQGRARGGQTMPARLSVCCPCPHRDPYLHHRGASARTLKGSKRPSHLVFAWRPSTTTDPKFHPAWSFGPQPFAARAISGPPAFRMDR